MSDTAVAPPPVTTPPPVTPPPPAPEWHAGIEPELLGVAQNKGWKLTDPKEAFSAATKAYREAQKFVGIPPEELLRMPKPTAQPAELDAFWQKLGAPKDAKEYDFSGVKFSDGTDLDVGFADTMRESFAKMRMPKESAAEITRSFVKFMEGEDAKETAVMSGKVAQDKAALEKSWGPNMEANMFVAKTTLGKLAAAAQLPPEKAQQAWDALSKVGGIGAATAMEMLRVIGARMGEDRFVSSGSGTNTGLPMTREAALARLTELKADKAFVTRYIDGDVMARQEMNGLHAIIAGQRAA
jgi:hypothetical protein